MYFLRKIIFLFSSKEKNIMVLGKKISISPDNTKKIIFQCYFYVKTIFSENLKKISCIHAFFWETSSFIFCLKNKIVFFGKKKYHLSWYYKKDHIASQFFWKDLPFRTFWKRKYGFSCSECTGNKKIQNVMTRTRFQSILQNLQFSNNNNDGKIDKSYKIRPVIEHLNKVFAETLSNSPFQSVDEHMCKFKGRSSMKQYIKNKLIK